MPELGKGEWKKKPMFASDEKVDFLMYCGVIKRLSP